jgi:hypothetical protein
MHGYNDDALSIGCKAPTNVVLMFPNKVQMALASPFMQVVPDAEPSIYHYATTMLLNAGLYCSPRADGQPGPAGRGTSA